MIHLKLIAICFNVSRGTSGSDVKILFLRMFHVKQFVNFGDLLQGRVLFRGKTDERKCLRKKHGELAGIVAKNEKWCLWERD